MNSAPTQTRPGTRKRLVILGSTGSIGTQTLEVVRTHPNEFEVLALACRSNSTRLLEQASEFQPRFICAKDLDARNARSLKSTESLPYPEGLSLMARLQEADVVVVATVGMAGFSPTLAALKTGNDVALASKEMLVMGGEILSGLAETSGAKILPIDSEHNAIWQCLRGEDHDSIRRLILTASGGPFRTWPLSKIRSAMAAEALQHPNWEMGPKVTVDSASLLNKGLEVIEAHWLFQIGYPSIDVIVHPESIIHSMVEFHDGSIKAQLGAPDMRLPIQYGIANAERLNHAYTPLTLDKLSQLTFEPPDEDRFPLLAMARMAATIGGTHPATLCGADDAATHWFINGGGTFGAMTDAIQEVMDKTSSTPVTDIGTVVEAHQQGFDYATRLLD